VTNDPGGDPAIAIDDLVVEYHRGGYPIRPLDGLSFTIDRGSLTIVLGPSGCGKTTLLSCLAAMQRPTSGRIVVEGHDIGALPAAELASYRRDCVGVVFQAFNLVPSLTAAENVMVPMWAAGQRGKAPRRRAAALLDEVGLADRAEHRPGSLSGGQMQRVGIARALALDPPVVLADEPTANLDHVQVESVLRILRSLTSRDRTVLVSTHDHRLVPLADRVIDLSPGAASDLNPQITVTLACGATLFAEGEPSDRLYVVESGRIDLARGDSLIGSAGPGDVFGEMGPVFGLPRSAGAVAAEASVLIGYTPAAFADRFGGDELRRLVGRW
jgi:putative ABC transport system ATP-binding protein